MGMKIGMTAFTKLICNSNEITKAYLGTTEVYSSLTLRNIQVGDNLSGATLYLNFPDNIHSSITSSSTLISTSAADYYIYIIANSSFVLIAYKTSPSSGVSVYWYTISTSSVDVNETSVILPSAFGTVTSMNTSSAAYQYIKIYD